MPSDSGKGSSCSSSSPATLKRTRRFSVFKSPVPTLILQTQNTICQLLLELDDEYLDIRKHTASGDRLRLFTQYFAHDLSLHEFYLLTFSFLDAVHYDPQKAAKLMVQAGCYRKQQNLNRIHYIPSVFPLIGYDSDEVCRVLRLPSVLNPPTPPPSAAAASSPTGQSNGSATPSPTGSPFSKNQSQMTSTENTDGRAEANEETADGNFPPGSLHTNETTPAIQHTNSGHHHHHSYPSTNQITHAVTKVLLTPTTLMTAAFKVVSHSLSQQVEQQTEPSPLASSCSVGSPVQTRRKDKSGTEEENITNVTPQPLAALPDVEVTATMAKACSDSSEFLMESSRHQSQCFSLMQADGGVVDLMCLNPVLQPIVNVVRRYVRIAFHHSDKEHRPVICISVLSLSCKKLMTELKMLNAGHADPKQLLRLYFTYLLEVIQLLIRYNQRKYYGDQRELVFKECDRKGQFQVANGVMSCTIILSSTPVYDKPSTVSGRRMLRRLLRSLTSISEHFYPTVIDHIYITSSASGGDPTSAYRALRRVLSPATREKVIFLDASELLQLHRVINPTFLPSQWNGLCDCVECTACHVRDRSAVSVCVTDAESTSHEGTVPEELDHISSPLMSTHKERIPPNRRMKRFMGLSVNEEVNWDFCSGKDTVWFSAVFVSATQGNVDVIVPQTKCRDGSGHYVCDVPGTFIVEWVNPSRWWSRKLHAKLGKF